MHIECRRRLQGVGESRLRYVYDVSIPVREDLLEVARDRGPVQRYPRRDRRLGGANVYLEVDELLSGLDLLVGITDLEASLRVQGLVNGVAHLLDDVGEPLREVVDPADDLPRPRVVEDAIQRLACEPLDQFLCGMTGAALEGRFRRVLLQLGGEGGHTEHRDLRFDKVADLCLGVAGQQLLQDRPLTGDALVDAVDVGEYPADVLARHRLDERPDPDVGHSGQQLLSLIVRICGFKYCVHRVDGAVHTQHIEEVLIQVDGAIVQLIDLLQSRFNPLQATQDIIQNSLRNPVEGLAGPLLDDRFREAVSPLLELARVEGGVGQGLAQDLTAGCAEDRLDERQPTLVCPRCCHGYVDRHADTEVKGRMTVLLHGHPDPLGLVHRRRDDHLKSARELVAGLEIGARLHREGRDQVSGAQLVAGFALHLVAEAGLDAEIEEPGDPTRDELVGAEGDRMAFRGDTGQARLRQTRFSEGGAHRLIDSRVPAGGTALQPLVAAARVEAHADVQARRKRSGHGALHAQAGFERQRDDALTPLQGDVFRKQRLQIRWIARFERQ